jgi:flagellar P-ring protein FlgI
MKSLLLLIFTVASLSGAGTRLKEVVGIEGVRDNQLMGYGLVVGLNGTGDKQLTLFSNQTLTNLLKRMGVTVDPTQMQVKNMAAVMVTANLPPFSQPGNRIDITTAAIGDARSLQGGVLLLTALKGPDGKIYAEAQGPVVTGGFVAGRGGATQTVNHPTVGLTAGGAIVEQAPPSVAPSSKFKLQLREADFTTAARVVEALNQHFAPGNPPIAKAESSGVVAVEMPGAYAAKPVEFVAEMENLSVEVDRVAKVVINERTGTIVMGKDVKIRPIAIMQGAMSVQIKTTLEVSQPAPLSGGTTAVTPDVKVDVKEDKTKNIVLNQGATVEELVRALQAIGSTARDVIAILQSLRSAGAMDAEIEVL